MGQPGDKPASHRAPAHRDHRIARTFSFRWLHPAGATAGESNSLLVEFTLTPEGGHTRLRLAESGLPQIHWPKEQKEAYAAQNSKGWDIHLAHLRDYAEGQHEGL